MIDRGSLFSKYCNSIIPIGHIFNDKRNLPINAKYLLPGKIKGKKIFVFPCATAFILKIDEDKTQLVTANHAFPDIEKNIDLGLFVVPQTNTLYELSFITMNDIKAYPGVKEFFLLPNQDICIFEVDTPEFLFYSKPRPVPLGPDFKIGDPVCTIGYPFIGFDGRDQQGVPNFRFVNRLTSAHLSSTWIENDTVILEFDNYVGPGNSGGPLFNLRTGSVIGVVTSTRTESNPNNPFIKSMTTFSHATYIAELNRACQKFSNIPDLICSHCHSKNKQHR